MWYIVTYALLMVISGCIICRSNKKKLDCIRLFRNKAKENGCVELYDKYMNIEDPAGQLTPQLCFDMAMSKEDRLLDCVRDNLGTFNHLVGKYMETAEDDPKRKTIHVNMMRVWKLLTLEEQAMADEHTAFLAEQEG